MYYKQQQAKLKYEANKWKDKINPRVYDALMTWVIEVTD